ncbi:MAG TPA: peptidoglycan-binding protein [Nonomuraea sp.]|nr:peptidoglycan-binding protein [Nonomuraea sp.]
MRTSLLALLLLLGLTAASPAEAAVEPTPGVRVTGGDISWPNCPRGMGIPSRRTLGNPMPLDSASFVIIGLTNGPGFVANPCLADQVAWAKATGRWTAAYAMTTFPRRGERATYAASGPWSATDPLGALRNAGYAQGLFNVASMRATGLDVPLVWVDVEPYPTHPWTRSVPRNRAVIAGAVRAYEDSGYRVGFYSYANGWRTVVGNWRKPSYPTWYPVGTDGLRAAYARCRMPSFSGGQVLIGQWVEGRRDRNVSCPALHGRAERPHPLTALLGRAWPLGTTGPDVVTLQRGLNMRPQYVTGVVDDRTRRVVAAYQRLRGWTETGVATDQELTALGAGTVRPGRLSRLPGFFTAY